MNLDTVRIDTASIPKKVRDQLAEGLLEAFRRYVSTPEGRADIDRRVEAQKKSRP